jgi:pantothenate kinase-related protein Tda10
MTKTVNIPLTELQEIYQGIEAFVLNTPADATDLASWKEQVELRMSAARALGHLNA